MRRMPILPIALASAAVWLTGCQRSGPNTTPAALDKQGATPGPVTPLRWRFAYDDAGRLTRLTDPAGRATEFRVAQGPEGQVLGLERATAGMPPVRHALDPQGRRVSRTDATGSTRFAYDGFGRPASVTPPDGPALHYDHDTLGRLTRLGIGDRVGLTYRYDYIGRLTEIGTPLGPIAFRFARDHVERVLPNGVRTTWEYGPDGHLTALSHADARGETLAAFAYAYRPDGRLAAVTERRLARGRELKLTKTYDYDLAHRLTAVRVESPDGQRATTRYEYDALGNRTREVRPDGTAISSTFDAIGRLLTHEGQTRGHDAAGNLLGLSDASGPSLLSYTPDQRLESVRGATGEVRYAYDGDGRLVSRKTQSGATRFVTDPWADFWKPLASREPDGATTVYVWDGPLPLLALNDATGGERVTFFLHDHLGSVVAEVGADGAVAAAHDYDAFGVPIAARSGFAPGFAGLFFDAETGVYHADARALVPHLGRFLQPDPVHRVPAGIQDSLTCYSYCGSDPVNRVDVDGMAPNPPPFMIQNDLDRLIRMSTRRPPPTIEQPTRSPSVTFSQQVESAVSLFPHAFSEGFIPFNYGNWAGAYRAPAAGIVPGAKESHWETWAAQKSLPGWLDHGDRGAFYHDLRLQRLEAYNDRLGAFDLGDLSVGIIHNQLATALDVSKHRPETPRAGKVFAYAASPVFHSFATISYWLSAYTGRETRVPDSFMPAGGKTPRPISPYVDPLTEKYDGDWTPLSRVVASIADEKERTATQDALNELRSKQGHGGASPPGGGGSVSGSISGSLTPATVGGVYLRGAAGALADLGNLRGVARDDHGRFVLLADDGRRAELPPLSLDDVVVVFLSVYNGASPYVSIDPDPKDPNGDRMLVRHDPRTARTRVGWLLFEADRIMKTYSLKEDNVTKLPVRSRVEGYEDLFDIAFKGGRGGTGWERFWIVPASVTRRATRDTTFLEVPLELKTEPMTMTARGTLASSTRPPSAKARAFTSWFTRNYDGIDRETRSASPDGKGGPVAVYAELKRVALVVAVAETLRDQGVPIPGWMRDHHVAPFPVPTETPAINAEHRRENGRSVQTLRIHGGVGLSAHEGAGIRNVPATPADEALARSLRQAVANAPALRPVAFDHEGRRYQAVALPGAGTKAPGACRLAEVDLEVPVPGGEPLRLTRQFHSFFEPDDIFGGAWTLDLPRIDKRLVPLERKGNQTSYRVEPHLASPLGTVSGKAALFEADDAPFGTPTAVADLPGSDRLHVDREGLDVVAIETGRGRYVRPVRNGSGRLERLEAWVGKAKRAEVRFEYDAQGRLVAAQGSDGKVARYRHRDDGRLAAVTQADGTTLGYDDRDGLITRVERNGKEVARYAYNARGQIARTSAPGVPEATFTVETGPDGGETLVRASTLADGTRLEKRALADGGEQLRLAPLGGPEHVLTRSADGRQLGWTRPEGGTTTVSVTPRSDGDEAVLSRDGRRAAVERSDRQGRLVEATYGDALKVQPEYAPDGALRAVVLRPAEGPDTLRLVTDAEGRIVRVEETRDGKTSAFEVGTNPGPDRVAIAHDDRGRPTTLTTPWGETQRWAYAAPEDPTPARAEIEVETPWDDARARAVAEFDHGRPTRLVDFDGGETRVAYADPANPSSPPASVVAPDVPPLTYRHDDHGRLTEVVCGAVYRVVYDHDDQGRLIGLSVEPRAASD